MIKLFFLSFLFLNLFANDTVLDSLVLSKIKKTVEKEEEIAKAYKKYLLDNGSVPTIENLKTNGKYLPESFNVINPFGKEMKISTSSDFSIEDSLPENLKENLYDYYYSNRYRTTTKAPMSFNSNIVKIKLTTKENFIFDNRSLITTSKTNITNKYYLEKGVLNWYDSSGNYKFSYDKDLIVDSSVAILDDNGNYTASFVALMAGKNIMYSGLTILRENAGVVEDFLNTNNGAVALNEEKNKYGATIVQFSRRAGGMIVNGDIYAWGNNANRIVGINEDTYTGGSSGRFPVINTLVRLKAQVIDDDLTDGFDLNNINNNAGSDRTYYSSPMRPKFIDFFSTVFYGTCGITTKGELYCGGSTGLEFTFGSQFTQTDNEGTSGREMMYRSTFFNGGLTSPKAKKVFANNQIWHILSTSGDIYRWGYDFSGFAGTGNRRWNLNSNNYIIDSNKLPEIITVVNSGESVKFNDITYLLTIGYRKIGALSSTGDIYIWGVETENSNNYDCTERWQYIDFNLCSPTKVSTSNSTMTQNLTFNSIQGGLEAFIATATDGNYYKIYHPYGKKIQVEKIDDIITNKFGATALSNPNIISVDFSSDGNDLTKINQGIVWVNSDNELKGDYYTPSNKNDSLFQNAINAIKWKKIKVVQDDNGMCGIDVNNQMYCWGIMSFYRDGSANSDKIGNTFMMPIFNSNLYDLTKDFMVVEGGYSGYLTNMTSGDWSTTTSDGKTGAFFMKYPTYIGGFNYEFEFK